MTARRSPTAGSEILCGAIRQRRRANDLDPPSKIEVRRYCKGLNIEMTIFSCFIWKMVLSLADTLIESGRFLVKPNHTWGSRWTNHDDMKPHSPEMNVGFFCFWTFDDGKHCQDSDGVITDIYSATQSLSLNLLTSINNRWSLGKISCAFIRVAWRDKIDNRPQLPWDHPTTPTLIKLPGNIRMLLRS